MTLQDAIALQPAWVGIWLKVLVACAFVLPLTLLIWKPTRLLSVLTVAAGVAGGLTIQWIFGQFGFVRLLGLGHIVFWTPLAVYLVVRLRRGGLPRVPRVIVSVVLAAISLSLALDYIDVARYALGDRTPMTGTEPGAA